MTPSLVDADSFLAVSYGSVNTRALLFDIVGGQYHFIASGMAPSTVDAPYHDASEGLHFALLHLQDITGRRFVTDEGKLIIPAEEDGSGVDHIVLTYSAGPELRLALMGLLPDVSIESARKLADSVSCRIVENIGLNDRRRFEDQLDALIKADPDLILLVGGSENGANRSVLKLAELAVMLCRLQPAERRTKVLFAGNQALAVKIKEVLEKFTTVWVTKNIRPAIDQEQLYPAMDVFSQIVTIIRSEQYGGIKSIAGVSSAPPIPASHAFGRMLRFLSKVHATGKPVLGVDVGANSTTLGVASGGNLRLTAVPLGTGAMINQLTQPSRLQELSQWAPPEWTETMLRDYLWQKSLEPGRLPADPDSMSMEQAATRLILRLAQQNLLSRHPDISLSFDPIFITGASLAQASSPAQSLLMLLDGLQLSGISTVILDQYGILNALGAAASVNAFLPVQVLETGALLNLGTVICPLGQSRHGATILRVRMQVENGQETQIEVKQGSIVSLPIPLDQRARLRLEPSRGIEIDPYNPNRSIDLKVVGGLCGAVIDARGRPLILPADPKRRRELIKKWELSLGI